MSIPVLMGFLFEVMMPDGLGLFMGLRGVQSGKSIMGLYFGPRGPIDWDPVSGGLKGHRGSACYIMATISRTGFPGASMAYGPDPMMGFRARFRGIVSKFNYRHHFGPQP